MKSTAGNSIFEFTANFDIIRNFIFILDKNGIIRNINKKGCETLGVTKREAIGADWFDNFMVPDVRQQTKIPFLNAIRNQTLSENFENAILCRNGRERDMLWHTSFLKDKKDRVQGVLCSGEDVTELRQSEKRLRESEENYRTLVENIYQVVYRLDFHGDVRKIYPRIYPTFANNRVKDFCGYSVDEFQKGSIIYLEQIHPDDRENSAKLFFKMLETKKPVYRTYRFRHKNGSYNWFEDTLIPKLDSAGHVTGLFGVIYEVSAKIQQLETIREYEQFFSLSSDMFCIAQGEFFAKVNPGFLKVLGYEEQEVVSKSFFDFIHPDDLQKTIDETKKFREGHRSINFENRYVTRDGGYRWISWTAEPPDKNGISYATGRDITEQKEALSTIRDYETFFKLSQDMLCIAGTDGFFKKINPSFERVLGYSSKELLSKPFVDFVHPEDRENCLAELSHLAKGGKTINFENRYRCKDGSYKWLSWTSSPAAESQLVYAVARDISSRKEREEQLRKSEAFLNSVVENIPNMIFVKDAKGLRFVRFNKAGEELLGYKRDKLIGKNDYDFFPKKEADFFTRKDREVLKGRKLIDIPEEEIETRHKGTRLLHTKKIPLYDQQGDPEYLLGISEDITEVRQTEEALRKSEEKYREIVHLIQEGVWVIDKDNVTTFVNEEMGKMLGYQPSEMIGRTVFSFMDEEGKSIAKKNTSKTKKGIIQRHDYKLKTKSGDDRWVILNARPIKDAAGKYGGSIASVVDVTERKKSEEIIRENEQKLIEAQKIAGVGSWEWNVITGEIFWSEQTYRLFGLDPSHAKITWREFRSHIHPDDRDMLTYNVDNSVKKGNPFELEMRVIWPNNKSVHYIIGRGKPVRIKNKTVKIIGTVMDITERKLAEATVMNALVKGQDSERRRIAEDLHDSLGQKLSAIKMFVENSCSDGNKDAVKNAEKIEMMLNETISEVRNISHNLMPAALEDFGLTNALMELCNKSSKKYGTVISFQAYDVKPGIDKSIKFGVYRIVQELINNAMKHAKAKEVVVQLFQRDNALILTIEDDGKGFNSKKINFDKTLGLNSITSRAKALNGIFNLDTSPGRGTIASVEIPLKYEKRKNSRSR